MSSEEERNMIDPDKVRCELLRMVIPIHKKIDQLFKELYAQYVTEENQDNMQCDVRLISINGIQALLQHVAIQINLLTLPISFLNSEYYKKIETLRPKFSKINEQDWTDLLKDIKVIMDKEYDIVGYNFNDVPNDLVPFRYSNPYLLDQTGDYIFLISHLIEQIVLASFMRTDNLFNQLVDKLDDMQTDAVQTQSLEKNVPEGKLNKKWDKLVNQLRLTSEDRDQLIEFSRIRNAMTHSNGLKKDGTLIDSNFPNTMLLLSRMIDILETVLLHSKIKEIAYIPDTAAEKSIAQKVDANV